MSPCSLVGAFPEVGTGPGAGPAGAAMAPMAFEAVRQKLQSRSVRMARGQCVVSLWVSFWDLQKGGGGQAVWQGRSECAALASAAAGTFPHLAADEPSSLPLESCAETGSWKREGYAWGGLGVPGNRVSPLKRSWGWDVEVQTLNWRWR